MSINASDVVAVASHGEFVCECCLSGHAESSVFYDWADAQECAENHGYLSPVFVSDIEAGDVCGRCHSLLLWESSLEY